MKSVKLQSVAMMMTVATLTGCQHIQLVRSPLPITLHPITHSQQLEQAITPTLPQKNKPQKPSAAEHVRQVYLLEDWF